MIQYLPKNNAVQEIYAQMTNLFVPVGVDSGATPDTGSTISPIVLCSDKQVQDIFGPNDPSGTMYKKNLEYVDGYLNVLLFSLDEHTISSVTYTIGTSQPVTADISGAGEPMVYFDSPEEDTGYYQETYAQIELSAGQHNITVSVISENGTYTLTGTVTVE